MVFRLREILKDKNMTIGQLSEISGISQSNLSNYMSGKISPTLDTLNRLAGALDIELVDLFKKKEDIVLMVRYNDELVEINKKDLIDFIIQKKGKYGKKHMETIG